MTPEEQVVEDIKAHIATLRGSEQDIVQAYANMFRTLAKEDPLVQIAFALVGAELAAQS